MFFCGDVSVSGRYDNLDFRFDFADDSQAIFLNLEGALCSRSRSEELITKRRVFNTDAVIRLLRGNHVTGCILANNHITDFDDQGLTLKTFAEAGMKHTGYGRNLKEAAEPLYFSEGGEEYSLLAFGWNVTGCRYANSRKKGVNPMEADNVLRQIRIERRMGRKVIVFFHWNYTYELYPMPAHRELAKMAVDSGAALIIGCHPHCIQGIEYYQGVPIVYSLGNWMFDNNVYFSGRLSTKEQGLDELVVEYTPQELKCHWYRFDSAKSVPIHIASECAKDSKLIKELIPFEGMDDAEYAAWFKKNRKIHRLFPVFVSNRNRVRNHLFSSYIFFRDRIVRKVRDAIRCLLKR